MKTYFPLLGAVSIAFALASHANAQPPSVRTNGSTQQSSKKSLWPQKNPPSNSTSSSKSSSSGQSNAADSAADSSSQVPAPDVKFLGISLNQAKPGVAASAMRMGRNFGNGGGDVAQSAPSVDANREANRILGYPSSSQPSGSSSQSAMPPLPKPPKEGFFKKLLSSKPKETNPGPLPAPPNLGGQAEMEIESPVPPGTIQPQKPTRRAPNLALPNPNANVGGQERVYDRIDLLEPNQYSNRGLLRNNNAPSNNAYEDVGDQLGGDSVNQSSGNISPPLPPLPRQRTQHAPAALQQKLPPLPQPPQE